MPLTIRNAAAADLDALRSVFRRAALTNDADRAPAQRLLAAGGSGAALRSRRPGWTA